MQNLVAKPQAPGIFSILENRNDVIMLSLQTGLLFSGIFCVQYYTGSLSLAATALLGSAMGMICGIWLHRFGK